MKVKYRVTNPESPEPDYEAVETVPCCQECLDAWERETFTFEAGVDLDTDESVAIVCVRAYERTDEGEFESALPMYYCPFCGTGILCVEVDD
ncbi:hypothetical protein SAMN04487949_2986 [Halogranum gelatinilyticum]|uniref:Uncharacterized protein n=1 Tax=Halogranum gelatinilyticum TaxID=660521 RepID=A0A1G9XGW8_9EURY|nr:hypothetical protein [Halogranum gelatinilyticum]SDM95947.1 hypothetical protein SAMN04487949_2986 [Halogranum gelatinilyticum]